uniref:Metallo-beta-lactamase domain-containing protein n=1 Tax=Megaviridae environmental sample TaxID=1737588 RepID=A0A5J6VKU7_9VIRU|nr:MAG: hypothetical protein [Megaviridae environmental sample]
MRAITPTNNKYTIPNIGEIEIAGYSRACFRTGFIVKPYNIYLDGGVPSEISPNAILITHGHYDHIASIQSILQNNIKCPVMHKDCLTHNLNKAVQAFYCLNSNLSTKKISINSIVEKHAMFSINKTNIYIKTYELSHSVPCQGYGIYIIKKKLKEEYKGMTSKQIIELKKTTEITHNVNIPLLMYCCDTDSNINVNFSVYPIVIIECTFIDDEHYIEAKKKKHMHWNDIVKLLKSCTDTHFILIHFSTRYKDDYLKEFEEKQKETYTNFEFWL